MLSGAFMRRVCFAGLSFKVTKISAVEFRLFVPGERVFITLSRIGLEKIIREQYGLKEKTSVKKY
jgi:anti-anti-sigma regulatory factor